MRDVVIASAVRTAVGTFGGALRDIPAVELGKIAVQEAVKRAKIKPEQVEEVILGNVLTAGQGQNPARQVVIRSGIPKEVPATTINKVCASGLKSVMMAAQVIKAGDADILVAGGIESMSMAPFLLPGARWGYRMNDGALIDGMIHDGLLDIFNRYHMGITAENVAEKFGVTRQEQDALAFRSQQNAGRAIKEALQRIHRALALNPDFSPFGPVPYGEEKGVGGAAAEENRAPAGEETFPQDEASPAPPKTPKPRKRRNPLVKKITPNAIVKRIKLGQSAVSVCMDFFGEDSRECFTEGNVIYINRDHPLFKREARKPSAFTMYVARLMTQEISLMKETKSPRLAFSRQSKLLKDAFADFPPPGNRSSGE